MVTSNKELTWVYFQVVQQNTPQHSVGSRIKTHSLVSAALAGWCEEVSVVNCTQQWAVVNRESVIS